MARAPLTNGPAALFDPDADPAEAITQPLPVLSPDASGRLRAGRHRNPRRAARVRAARTPVRNGLLGASAAVAMGAVAVVSGLMPAGVFSVGPDAAHDRGAGTSGQILTEEQPPHVVPPGSRLPGAAPADRPERREQADRAAAPRPVRVAAE
ncbi:hypothetical protein AB0K09_31175, partial [Streptomyces sp. NPDC049577]